MTEYLDDRGGGPAASILTEEVVFSSHGEECAATLYRPAVTVGELVPCVVMGNGLSLTRRDGIPRFARRFAAAGIAALAFDYRHLGDSTGEPRQLIDHRRQAADFAAASAYARTLEGIDPSRVAVWGFSFGGGMALAAAAKDDHLAAAIITFPVLDALATIRKLRPRALVRTLGHAMRALGSRQPLRMRVAGPPGSDALLTQPEALPGLESLRARDSRWRNELRALPTRPLALFRPVRDAHRVRCPLLACLGTRDTIAPVRPIVRAARRAPHGELRGYPAGHFAAFFDAFDQVAADQVAFLTRHLEPGGDTI